MNDTTKVTGLKKADLPETIQLYKDLGKRTEDPTNISLHTYMFTCDLHTR